MRLQASVSEKLFWNLRENRIDYRAILLMNYRMEVFRCTTPH